MSETTRYNNLTAQDGAVLVGWNETNTTLEGTLGLVFDFAPLVASRLRVKPTGILLTPSSLTPMSGATVQVYVVDESNPANYSGALLPVTRGEILPELLVCQLQGTNSNFWTVDSPTFYSFGQEFSSGAWRDSQVLKTNWQRFWARRVAREDWGGRIALTAFGGGVVQFYSSEHATESFRPQVEVLQWSEHTGHADWPLDRGRSLHDMRSGLPAMAAELVEDGFSPGVWVRQDQWDDEDRRGEAILPAGEGMVRDKVPQ